MSVTSAIVRIRGKHMLFVSGMFFDAECFVEALGLWDFKCSLVFPSLVLANE